MSSSLRLSAAANVDLPKRGTRTSKGLHCSHGDGKLRNIQYAV